MSDSVERSAAGEGEACEHNFGVTHRGGKTFCPRCKVPMYFDDDDSCWYPEPEVARVPVSDEAEVAYDMWLETWRHPKPVPSLEAAFFAGFRARGEDA